MKLKVEHWYKVIERDDVPEHRTLLDLPEDEVGTLVIRLSKEFDVGIMNRQDPRTRKQRARNDPPWENIPILAIDSLGGKFRQR